MAPTTVAQRGTSSTLSRDQLLGLRAMLEQQRAFRVHQLVELAGPKSGAALGSAYAEVTTVLAQGARRALHDVQRALWRMDEGRYGRCTRCDTTLSVERLEILPHAALCMPCERETRLSAE